MEGNSSHFRLKRGGVGRARKHAAYVIGVEKYASREDVLFVSSGNMPGWAAADRLAFWDAADQHERANGRTYLEEEIAIPRELSPEQAKKLVDSWIAKEFGNRHVWMYGIHSKPAEDGKPNIHCHLMFSDRIVDGFERPPELFFRRPASRYRDRKTGELRDPDPAKGGTGKDRRWNDREIVKELRGRWAAHANEFLAEHGHRPRLDLRSNAERGLGDPEPKVGPDRKQKPDRWRDARKEKVHAIRQQRRSKHEEIQAIKTELREARGARARRDACSCRDANARGQRPFSRSPLAAMQAEQRADRTVFRWSHGAAAGRAAIIDRGDQLTLAGRSSGPKVRALIELAKAKGFGSVVLTGSAEFKRLAVREALKEGLTVTNPELANLISEIRNEEEVEMKERQPRSLRDQRIELARQWLATAAPLNAMEATALRADPERLLLLFEQRPDARRWYLIQRQRAQGVPEPLLGFEIGRQELAGSFRGTVRHVGKRVWIEPEERPGHVVPITPSQPVQPGQHLAVRRDGDRLEVAVIRECDNTPRP